jgi:polysaccharide export outer membrane protein
MQEVSLVAMTKKILPASMVACLLVLGGCDTVPNNGPIARDVVASSAGKNEYALPESRIVYDVVKVDQRVSNSVTQLGQPSLVRTFGFGGSLGTPVLGVGDELAVTIFEAGPDGLFSTTEHKSTSLPVIVQPDGTGQIPYAGSVHFAGLTLEQARAEIVKALKSKAVEPDVIVGMTKNASREVSVQGSVMRSGIVQLGLPAEPLTAVIAEAGGPAKASYDTYVTLTRGRKSSTVLLQSIIDNPRDDINVRPNDKIFLTYDPQTFTALGSTAKPGKIPFETSQLSLVEATALTGGSNPLLADPEGYFIFRYEYEAVYRQVVGESRFRELLAKGMMANKDGLYPIVYRIDMLDPQSYIVTQSFPVRNKDVVYLSRHPAVDFVKFMTIVNSPLNLVKNVQYMVNH